MRRPRHLTPKNAERFQDSALIAKYHLRLPYPDDLFVMLLQLMPDDSQRVLDVGTGTGELARRLALMVQQVDAVDISDGMIAKAQLEPNGDADNIRWIVSAVEDVELTTSYDLILGGDSIHWMDWHTVFPKFRDLLNPDGVVALVSRNELATDWQAELIALIIKYSVYQDFESYDLVEELTKRKLFHVIGTQDTEPISYQQSIDDYIQSFHSRGSLSPEAMSPQDLLAFDTELRHVLSNHLDSDVITLKTVASMTWGIPSLTS